jgi:hypothetical protein
VQNFYNICLSQQSMRESATFAVFSWQFRPSRYLFKCQNQFARKGLQDVRAMAESVSHKISTVGTRCTTWCHKLCVSMTASVCTTAILTFKIAWVILSHFLQKYGWHYVRTSSATSANC